MRLNLRPTRPEDLTFSPESDYTDGEGQPNDCRPEVETAMSHADSHGHAAHHEGERPYFSASQWEQFQRDDIAAGKAIILLMAGIFSIGLFLYLTIAIIVGNKALYTG